MKKPDCSFDNNNIVDASIWRRKARGFAIRTNDHLWGKNNEDPLSFLYLKGLNLKFSARMFLGWNKFGHKRPCEGWGLSGKGSFFIPPGLVVPYIVEKEVWAVFIISMKNLDLEAPPEIIIPGSYSGPFLLGPGNPEMKEANSIIQGLKIFQKDPERHRVKISLNDIRCYE